jgi:hypothetical protein
MQLKLRIGDLLLLFLESKLDLPSRMCAELLEQIAAPTQTPPFLRGGWRLPGTGRGRPEHSRTAWPLCPSFATLRSVVRHFALAAAPLRLAFSSACWARALSCSIAIRPRRRRATKSDTVEKHASPEPGTKVMGTPCDVRGCPSEACCCKDCAGLKSP